MSKKITITLEFDHEDTTREEIKKYLKDLIEGDELQWEVDDNTSFPSCIYLPHSEDYYDIHDTMDTTKLAKEIINENNKTR
tara:strand:+ start:213 stop:455 length:243 start_codon:yes stop_codon:yes gene_type:complete